MKFTFQPAGTNDAAILAALHTSVADELTRLHGRGPWSTSTTEKGVLYAMRHCRVFVARAGGKIIATLRLTTQKPWAIDADYFSTCRRPLYLLAMAVEPAMQRQGIGRRCLVEAKRVAKEWPADAIRLDAYDSPAGAGGFYAANGLAEVGRRTYRNAPLIYYERLLSRPGGSD
jgi:GNAT superfamily N-acetyltransferase